MSATTSAHQILARVRFGMSPEALPPELWEIVERYRGDLLNQAFALLGNLADAEEVVQETFCEAFRHRARLAGTGSLGAWLRSINRGNAFNRLRANRRSRNNMLRHEAEMPGRAMTTGGFSVIEIREAVAKAIETLPAEEREVLVLHYWEELSHEQIAEHLDISPRTVWQRLHDAFLKLHDKLGRFMGKGRPQSEKGQG